MPINSHSAPICYVEIPSTGPSHSAAFYKSVFGWESEESGLTDSKYWTFKTGDGQLMGGFDASKDAAVGGILFYIKVDDIALTLSSIDRAGSTTIRNKSAVGGEFGFTATFADPSGNHVGLWAAN